MTPQTPDEWPALPSPARPPSARVTASNTPPVYSSPFPPSEPSLRGRGKDSVRRGSGGRGGRGGGRRPASASDSQPAVLTGVAVQMEGLGPDAPAVPVVLGEPSRGDFCFVSFVEESTPVCCCAMHSSTWSHHVYLTNLPFLSLSPLQVVEEMLVVQAPAPLNPLPDPTLPPPPAHQVAGMKVGALPPPLLSRTLVAMLLLPRAPQGRAVGADCDCCHFLKLWFAVLSQVVSMRAYAPPLICFILPSSIPFPLTEHALFLHPCILLSACAANV